ncbi:MAG TPA: MMPL family transporter [Acidimicrobiales bacterium]|nr:MMPL family transporter [Acidimicrobiales bacterium]
MSVLERLARWSTRRRRLVLAGWVITLVAVGGLAAVAGGESANNFELPGSESQKVLDLLEERFPARAGDAAQLVFRADQGVTDPEVRAAMEALFAEIAAVEHVSGVESPYEPGVQAVSPEGTIAFASVQFDAVGPDVPRQRVRDVMALAATANGPGLQVELGGSLVSFADSDGPGGTEGIGLLAAIVVLLVTFGSVIAMGLPVLTALFGLGIGLSLVALGAHVIDVPQFAPQLATMIGLGVGIDYALFIVTRYRQGLHAGAEPDDAIAAAIDTSGRAVLFAGTTVVISLLGMFLMGLTFVRGLAVAAVVAVLLVMVASLSLLPAVLGFAGHGIDRFHIPGLRRDESAHRGSRWFRWSRFVQRRPWPLFLAGLTVLLVLAAPVLSIRLGSSDTGNDPTSKTTRRAYDLLTDGFGPGFNGPLLLGAELAVAGDTAALDRIRAAVTDVDGVAAVSAPRLNPAGDAAVMTVFPSTSPQDERTEALVHRLRDEVLPDAVADTGVEVKVGGITAIFIDVGETLAARLPLFIGTVIVLSCLLLMAVFRSVVVPVKAAIMNLLSIGAAYGVIVAVFQWGWGKDLFGVAKTGPIESFVPMMLFAVLFGLSMDYEVFLMSRIREEWDRTGDNALAVADGLAATARVITAAAAIMVAVFLSFVLGDERIVKLFGLGLASAILIDATIVRMVLVPSVMELIGPANWWLPRWLDRRLPHLAVDVSDPIVRAILDDEGATASGARTAADPISGNGRSDAPTTPASTPARPGPGRSRRSPGADTSGRSGSR